MRSDKLAVMHRSPDRADRSKLSRANWGTPRPFLDLLELEIGELFGVDLAATEQNRVARIFMGPGSPVAEDALAANAVERLPEGVWRRWFWCNPPYGRKIGRWIKLFEEIANAGGRVLSLLPSRPDTRWFHDLDPATCQEARQIKGRLQFVGAKWKAPFPSQLLYFGRPAGSPVRELRITRWSPPLKAMYEEKEKA